MFVLLDCALGVLLLILLLPLPILLSLLALALAKLAADGETNGSLLPLLPMLLLLTAPPAFAPAEAALASSMGKPKLSNIIGVVAAVAVPVAVPVLALPALLAVEGVSGGGVSSKSTGVRVRRGSGRPL